MRWLIDFFQMMFQMVKQWTMIDYVPEKTQLLATLRIYVDKDGTHYIKLGNHASHTSGYWFKQEESNHEGRNEKNREKTASIE